MSAKDSTDINVVSKWPLLSSRSLLVWMLAAVGFGLLPLFSYTLFRAFLSHESVQIYQIIEVADSFLIANTFLTLGVVNTFELSSNRFARSTLFVFLTLVALINAQVFAIRLVSDQVGVDSEIYRLASVVALLVSLLLCLLARVLRELDQITMGATASAADLEQLRSSVGDTIRELRSSVGNTIRELRSSVGNTIVELRSSVGDTIRETLEFEGDIEFSGFCQVAVDGNEVLADEDIRVDSKRSAGRMTITVGGSQSPLSRDSGAEPLAVHGSRTPELVSIRIVPEGVAAQFDQDEALVRLDGETALKTCSFDFRVDQDEVHNGEREIVITLLIDGTYARSLRRRILLADLNDSSQTS